MAAQFVRSLMTGWVTKLYVHNDFNFTFIGFEWLGILHGRFMYYCFAGMIVLALLVSAGLFYRAAILLLAILWTAVYLSCKIHYNNHYYLMVLLSWIMVIMPAGKRFSLDVSLRKHIATNQCYQWQIWVFIFQMGCMYLFAAFAKMGLDWLQAVPLKMWFHARAGRPYIGWLLGMHITPWLIAYGGLLFDLLVLPGMLYKKTRKWFFLLAVIFHLINGIIFQIGIFPYLALSLLIFFFPAFKSEKFLIERNLFGLRQNISLQKKKWISCLILIYAAFQIWLPIRHLFIKGPVSWTEEGYRMSWQMMVKSKRGTVFFNVKNIKSDSIWTVKPQSFINDEYINEAILRPDIIWQTAQFFKKKFDERNIKVALYAHSSVSLNYRSYQPLTDTSIDLANIKWNYFGHNKWILMEKK